MIKENFFNKIPSQRAILVTPLNWGLGHATRCIPIINELISRNFRIIIGAGGAGFSLLKKEFPSILILRTHDYEIRYAKKKIWLPFSLFLQSPIIIFSILKDHVWLCNVVKKHQIDAVISDNRFGMYNKKIHSVYLTHQLLIKTGKNFSEKHLQKLHYYFIKKFNNCWVPDYKENGLAGALSHPKKLPLNVYYIGALSRFEKIENLPEVNELLICLSGPEPQRTIFEKLILKQIKTCRKKILIVRGLPNAKSKIEQQQPNVKVVNHLSAQELNKAFIQSHIIICRSGYTTIMDLVKLGKNAVLVPTPGQTEQEYLADYLMKKKYFYSVDQDKFYLDDVLDKIESFSFNKFHYDMNVYKKKIGELLLSPDTANFANQ